MKILPRLRFGLTVALLLFVFGCSGKDEPGDKKGGDPIQGGVKYRVAVIPKGLTHEFWQSINRGSQRAAEDLKKKGLNVEVEFDGPRRESDATEQINLVRQKLGQKVHGIVLAPQHSKQMVPVVEEAHDEKVPVVIIDSNLDQKTLNARPELIVKYVATDNYNGGKLAAKHLIESLEKDDKKELNLVLFRYAVGSESTDQREQGFLDQVAEQTKAGKKIVIVSQDKYAGATIESAEREAGPLLLGLKGTQVDGIFAVNESATTGLLNAMRSQGLVKKIKVMGFDSSKPLLQALRDGEVEGLVIQDPHYMGYMGVWSLVHHLEGYDVGPSPQQLSTGEYIITRDNLEAEETRSKFDPESQKKRTIPTPEYKKK